MTPAAFILGLCIGLLIRSGLSAPPGPTTELDHLRECRADGWIFYDELRRLEALEHG